MTAYTDTIREQVLTPEAMERVQRAAQLLRTAAPAVKEALDLLAPIEWAMDDVAASVYEAGGRITDEEGDSVRAGVYQEAVTLAFDIMDTATRISRR